MIEESPRDRDIHQQIPTTTGAKKSKSPNMLSTRTLNWPQNQRNLESIELARKNRTGEKRSTKEGIERIFNVLNDGESRSTSKLAKDCGAAWSTTYWLLDLVEFVQSKPRVVREGNMLRKRFYRIVGPRRR